MRAQASSLESPALRSSWGSLHSSPGHAIKGGRIGQTTVPALASRRSPLRQCLPVRHPSSRGAAWLSVATSAERVPQWAIRSATPIMCRSGGGSPTWCQCARRSAAPSSGSASARDVSRPGRSRRSSRLPQNSGGGLRGPPPDMKRMSPGGRPPPPTARLTAYFFFFLAAFFFFAIEIVTSLRPHS